MMKANVTEIEKIIKEMQPSVLNNPSYNAGAAKLVQDGVKDKLAARAEANPFKPKGKLLS